VAIDGEGLVLAVGAIEEDSAATGVGGNQADDTGMGAGAVYLY
jgi:trimeric autotransporter adhesin